MALGSQHPNNASKSQMHSKSTAINQTKFFWFKEDCGYSKVSNGLSLLLLLSLSVPSSQRPPVTRVAEQVGFILHCSKGDHTS